MSVSVSHLYISSSESSAAASEAYNIQVAHLRHRHHDAFPITILEGIAQRNSVADFDRSPLLFTNRWTHVFRATLQVLNGNVCTYNWKPRCWLPISRTWIFLQVIMAKTLGQELGIFWREVGHTLGAETLGGRDILTKHFWYQKSRIIALWYSTEILTVNSSILSQCMHQTEAL